MRQACINITQVFMRYSVVRVVAHSHFQCVTRLVELTIVGVDDGQVVVGLRQLWVFLNQRLKSGCGCLQISCLGLGHALEKAHLGVTAVAAQVLISFGNGFGSVASLGQGGDIPIHIGLRRASEQKTRHGQQAQQGLWAEVRRHVGAFQGPEEPCSVLGLYSGRL